LALIDAGLPGSTQFEVFGEYGEFVAGLTWPTTP